MVWKVGYGPLKKQQTNKQKTLASGDLRCVFSQWSYWAASKAVKILSKIFVLSTEWSRIIRSGTRYGFNILILKVTEKLFL